MKILEEIKEYEVKKTADGKFVLVFFKQNEKIYLENCELVCFFIEDNILTIEYVHHKLPKVFEFKNIEKRTRYLLNKSKFLSLCEVSENNEEEAFIYTIVKKTK